MVSPGAGGAAPMNGIMACIDTRYPGITVTAGRARNVITRNLIWQTGDHGIQVAADAIVHENFISNTGGCGIYSREHQGAVPSNLRIERNHVIAKQNSAIRIVGSDRKQLSRKPIEILDNEFIAMTNGLAARFDNDVQVVASGNRGLGQVSGSSSFSEDWTSTSEHERELPEFRNHPAMKVLNVRTIRAALFSD